MGRVSKYKKIKSHDPFYRGPRKNMKRVDLCPENVDEQPIPKSLVRLMNGAEILKKGREKKKEKALHSGNFRAQKEDSAQVPAPKDSGTRDDGERSKESPMFTKRKGESLKSYLERLDMEANAQIMEAYRKSRKPSERRRRHLEERRRKALAKRKGLSLEDQITEFSDLKDEIKFGEVVRAPPQLKSKPRGSLAKSSPSTPLLLHQKAHLSPQDHPSKPGSRVPVVGLKRKQDIEIEREHAISVYRQKKKAKTQVLKTL